jgi:sugar phosphate isomerase/epimerase
MKCSVNRRDFLKTTSALGVGVGLAGLTGANLVAADAAAKGAPNAEKLGWRLGTQAWTFNQNTFFDAVDNTASLGLHYIEAFPSQKVGKDIAQAMGEGLSADARKAVKKKLADSGVKLVNFGVCGLPKDEGQSRKVFDFAKDMGIETIVSEPEEAAFDMLDKLTREYGINVAVHNHPKPSQYWNPDTELRVFKGRGKRIGACADTGHWPRSGLNSLDCLKKLEGRIISFHFKDLNKLGPDAHDVPWGTGENNVKAMLTEILRQNFKGVFSIEYEYDWGHAMPQIAQSVAYFDKIAAELAQTASVRPARRGLFHRRRDAVCPV